MTSSLIIISAETVSASKFWGYRVLIIIKHDYLGHRKWVGDWAGEKATESRFLPLSNDGVGPGKFPGSCISVSLDLVTLQILRPHPRVTEMQIEAGLSSFI